MLVIGRMHAAKDHYSLSEMQIHTNSIKCRRIANPAEREIAQQRICNFGKINAKTIVIIFVRLDTDNDLKMH